MTPNLGTLLRPLVVTWLRGPARRERDQLVLDTATAERYEPIELARHQNVGIALSRVRTPEEALAFVQAYGLLTRPGHWLEGEPLPPVLQELFPMFEQAADNLRRIIRTTMDVRAAERGNRDALARLREFFKVLHPDVDDRSLLIAANDWAAVGLTAGLHNVRPYVFEPAQLFPDPPRAPGQIRLALFSETLLGYCYISVVQALSAEPLAVCEECQRVFIVEDKRQKYCEAGCANRARFRKFKIKKAALKPSGRKRTHGKTTRAR